MGRGLLVGASATVMYVVVLTNCLDEHCEWWAQLWDPIDGSYADGDPVGFWRLHSLLQATHRPIDLRASLSRRKLLSY